MPDFQIPDNIRRSTRRRRRLVWMAAGVLCVVAVAALFHVLPSGPSVARDTLVIARVKAGAFRVRVQAPGVLRPRGERFVTASVPGTVASVLVRPGDPVKSATVLIRLVNPHLQSLVVTAGSNLADAKATLASTVATLDDTRLTLEGALATDRAVAEAASLRAKTERGLAAEHVVARLDYRKTVLDAATAQAQVGLTERRLAAFRDNQRAQLAAQKARVGAFRAALAEAGQNVASLAVTAGEAGVVQSVAAHPGQTLALGGAIARIASLTHLKAALDVAPSQAGEVVAGQGASIRLNDQGETRIAGVVTRVSPSVEKGSVRVDVKLPAKLPPGTRPDLAVLGDIDVTTIAHTLHVARPVDARPDSRATVYELVDGGRRAIPVRVRFGATSANAIQVLSGLKAGDRVIVSDTGRFAGKAMVRVR
ncbi:efflux RND transporter periplasmic adaptor subunit [Acidiphilium sp.]|uniref:efflux RND transporter periplasmic adaptor subunit n=1 Tax=Acidiphilium sp. TaxID=527 RepID=UPI00258689F7|nr:HlyD family efflux transporter periplasmic adaptor subunit [Acidiphilium sp.]